MSAEEILKAIGGAILEGEAAEAKASVSSAIEKQVDPATILRTAVIPAIQEMGTSMKDGDFFVPEVKMSTRALQAVADVLRPLVIPAQELPSYKAPLWTGEGDIDQVGEYLQSNMVPDANLTPVQLMGVLDMVAAGLNTHEFTPCKIQAKEVDG